jgi:hypothetical protein
VSVAIYAPAHGEKANIIFECAFAGKETRIVFHILEQVFGRSGVAPQAVDQSVNSEELAIIAFGFNYSIGEEQLAVVWRELDRGGLIAGVG